METLTPSYLLLNLPRTAKRVVVLAVDASLSVFSLWLALYLRLGEFAYLDAQYAPAVIVSLALSIPIFIIGGLYRAIFRYSGWPALMTVAKSVAIYGVFYATIFTAIGIIGVPRTVGLIQPILLFILIGLSRSLAYYWLGGEYKSRIGASAKERILIYGAGAAGRQIAAALSNNKDMKVVGFIDDDKKLKGQVLSGLTIYHSKNLKEQAERLKVTHVLLALPSVNHKRRQEVIEGIRSARLSVRTLPSLMDIAKGKITLSDIRDLDIDDLLRREPITPDVALLKKNIANKKVMVTGAGGSIGSELCRQILRLSPSSLILIEHSEFALYKINEELLAIKERYDLQSIEIHPVLTSVQNRASMEKAFSGFRPDTVYHAAAYKHVPLVESNPGEGIKNNVFGTKITAELSIKYGICHFLLISTDKAVRPTNVMGATKRWAELIIQNCAARAEKENLNQTFCAVRFGNVLGSSGSVVPLFRSQIAKGGPITLTHPEVTRYFMSTEESVGLVLQAGSLSDGGEIFLLDMGGPVKIMDLAYEMVQLSGYSVRDLDNPDGDIEIITTGLRPGEKLYEELLIDKNSSIKTLNPKVMKANEPILDNEVLQQKIAILNDFLCRGSLSEAINLLMELTV